MGANTFTWSGMAWDLEVDVACVGSGVGGLTAAWMTARAGASAVVLEKSHKLGGVSAWSGGEVWVAGNHLLPDPDADLDRAHAYLDFLAGGYADPTLAARLRQEGPRIVRLLGEVAGVPWLQIPDFPDYHHPHAPGTSASGRGLEVNLFHGPDLGPWRRRTWNTPHLPPGVTHAEWLGWGGLADVTGWDFALLARRVAEDKRAFGPGLVAWLVKAAMLDQAVPALVDTPVMRLVAEAGRVVGVEASHEGKPFLVRARRGVVLAVGGYDWNPTMARAFEALPEWNSVVLPTVEGDNVILGGEVGASLAGVPPHNLGMFFGYHLPGETHTDGRPLFRPSWEGGYPHALWVNRAGRRFCDESFYRQHLPAVRAWDGLRQEHPNYPPFLIFDTAFREKASLGPLFPGQELPASLVARGDTPRELALALGVDPDGLDATLERFNSFADGAVDPDFGRGRHPWSARMFGDRRRPNPNMGPVSRPPFFGLKLRPVGIGINAVGLRTDADARVVHLRGHAIPGLYACGNAAAPVDVGAGYQSGLANLRGITWGALAAEHALR